LRLYFPEATDRHRPKTVRQRSLKVLAMLVRHEDSRSTTCCDGSTPRSTTRTKTRTSSQRSMPSSPRAPENHSVELAKAVRRALARYLGLDADESGARIAIVILEMQVSWPCSLVISICHT
jgi:hypothetical protein